MTTDAVNALSNTLTNLGQAIESAKSFSITTDNAAQAREQILSQLQGYSHHLLNEAHSWIAFLFVTSGEAQESFKTISDTVERATDVLKTAESVAANKSDQIDDIIQTAREAAGKAGVGHFTSNFETEAKKLGTAAIWWLLFSAVAAGGTIALAIIFLGFLKVTGHADTTELVQLAISRIVVLGLMFAITVWCGRIYRATKHQQMVNRHRANALKTFQAFVQSSSDPVMQDAILMETTRSIFAITPSGYLGNEASSPDLGSKTVEIVKSAPSRDGS